MNIQIIAFGQRQPAWLYLAVADYQKRFSSPYQVDIIELPLMKRSNNAQLAMILEKEGQLMCAKMQRQALRIALDRTGQALDSLQLANKLTLATEQYTMMQCFIGGPEGLNEPCLKQCQQRWSLSALTLPHSIARLVLVEALYRAWSINRAHPYHR